jgi:hypothetical protein
MSALRNQNSAPAADLQSSTMTCLVVRRKYNMAKATTAIVNSSIVIKNRNFMMSSFHRKLD